MTRYALSGGEPYLSTNDLVSFCYFFEFSSEFLLLALLNSRKSGYMRPMGLNRPLVKVDLKVRPFSKSLDLFSFSPFESPLSKWIQHNKVRMLGLSITERLRQQCQLQAFFAVVQQPRYNAISLTSSSKTHSAPANRIAANSWSAAKSMKW